MRVLSFCLAACATLCGGFGVPHVNTVEARRIALAAPRAHAVRLVDDASQALEEEGEAAMAAVAAVLAENRAAAEAIASAQAEPAEAEMRQKSRLIICSELPMLTFMLKPTTWPRPTSLPLPTCNQSAWDERPPRPTRPLARTVPSSG